MDIIPTYHSHHTSSRHPASYSLYLRMPLHRVLRLPLPHYPSRYTHIHLTLQNPDSPYTMSAIQVQSYAAAVRGFTPTIHTDTYPHIASSGTELAGRSVFTSGASKGIGRATALSYARAGCQRIAVGARSDISSLVAELLAVIAATPSQPDTANPEPPVVVGVQLDVTSEASVAAAMATIDAALGARGLDVLVNNAGYLAGWRPLGETDSAQWWTTWDVNVHGTYLVVKHCLPLLLRSELRTNILTSSYGALVTRPGASAYQSAKFAVSEMLLE
jgi:NADP-dependent 3-hydroxy acid dehydrogenase YdfG